MHILSLEIAHSIHCTACYSLYTSLSHTYILYTTGGALPAVLAGAVVAFLVLTLLIVGIIVGAVLLGRAKRRRKPIEKEQKAVEVIECVEKKEELLEESVSKAVDGQRINDALPSHYERIQNDEEPGYESVDVAQQGRISQVDREGSRSKEDNYNVAEAAENTSSEDIGQDARERDQQDAQPEGNQNAVYAVVDKSKKKKHKKTHGGASATTTQGADTEEQHYEWSSGFGQDWFGNVVGESGRQEQERESEGDQQGPKSKLYTD